MPRWQKRKGECIFCWRCKLISIRLPGKWGRGKDGWTMWFCKKCHHAWVS